MSLAPTFIGLIIAALIYDFIAKYFGNAITTFLRVSLYIPQIIALPVVGILWAWMLSPNIGVINTVLRNIGLSSLALNWLGQGGTAIFALSIMMIWIQVGYTIVIFISGMSRLDPYLDEAGQLDGATWLQRFRVITIPQLYPEIAVVLVTTTVAALKVFGPVYVMTNGGPGDSTQVPAFFSYFHFFSTTRVGYGAAVATVLALLLTVLAISLLRLQRKLGLMR
jgi:raffinose/stachyose/melibiose transport system permease protein